MNLPKNRQIHEYLIDQLELINTPICNTPMSDHSLVLRVPMSQNKGHRVPGLRIPTQNPRVLETMEIWIKGFMTNR